ncbi:MAG: AAA family ATPase, partial [Paludibacteraceae bacterium]|nr:AAA family ATPase [Paludibacteraceae bacterium]
LERQIKQLEIEREAIRKEDDQPKLERLTKELDDKKAEANRMREQWRKEKAQYDTIQKEKVRIEEMKHEAEVAEREGNYGKVAELRYGKIQEAEKHIKEAEEALGAGGASLIDDTVTEDDIAEVVSRWTGIPVTKMQQSEREKLLCLEEELHKRVIGQDEAIQAVSDAIRRSRAGLQDPKRPIGSFIFLGTTGVGKTELAKALADYLFNDENMITRIDMSEYQEKFSATRLIGAPPGYVGYDEGGQLTEAIRHKPYSVVLFDEIEKAHPDVFNVLLQVLDDGRLTDNKGRTVNFKNTIIILTSNLGSQLIRENEEKGVDRETTKRQVFDLLKQTIRPEFLNRIDETIMFTPLSEEMIEQVVSLQITGIRNMLGRSAEQGGAGIDLRVTDDAIRYIAKEGYDPQFGARPVKRALQRLVLNELSKSIIAGKINPAKPVIVDLHNGELTFSN